MEQDINMNDNAVRPQFMAEMPRRGILDRPNSDHLNDNDVLKILDKYMHVHSKYKLDNDTQRMLYAHFWGFFNQQASITFYDLKYKPVYDINFELAWLNFLMDLPVGGLTQELRSLKIQMKQYSDILFYRCVGTSKHNINERIAQQLSVFQNISSGGTSGGGGGGFGNRLAGLFK